MRYQMKQRIWSFADNFEIKDASGTTAYQVKGKVFSWGDKLQMLDRNGKEVAYIAQKLLSLRPQYTIYRNGEAFAEVKKDFLSLFRDKFTLDVPGPNDYHITGSILDYDYRFERKGRTVAQVSKRFFSIRDSYGVDIEDGEDDIAILATCVVIDMVAHDDNA
ncbi:hypothetical protein GC175_02215 [bacterium]|nr:hypothetical protein [bacterium]